MSLTRLDFFITCQAIFFHAYKDVVWAGQSIIESLSTAEPLGTATGVSIAEASSTHRHGTTYVPLRIQGHDFKSLNPR